MARHYLEFSVRFFHNFALQCTFYVANYSTFFFFEKWSRGLISFFVLFENGFLDKASFAFHLPAPLFSNGISV